ncbi:histone PARylation factor 1-like [Uloborus diversus]|uniref:histone PARylation factor 1-like n=1 Tax=Uloborus diversus TaxID=327109 RepID=UPI00240A6E55|nr:histone PARylation factor 1-like [Uloborus diversus]
MQNDRDDADNPKQKQPLQKVVEPKSNGFLGDSLNKKSGETVEDILKLMPPDFFDFWNFCSTINKAKPEDAFAEIGFHLVGVYDLLAKKVPKTKTVYLHCHWRYYYDPPEFQTIIKLDGDDLFHIGYFSDDPSEVPRILASNKANSGAKLTLMGDNVFAAMNSALSKVLNRINEKKLKEKFLNIQRDLQVFAKKKKYSLETITGKTKNRQKRVVAKTFHSLGIVVPIVRDVGYRCLSETDASLKRALNKIVTAKDVKTKEENESILFDIIHNVHLANDECDFGTGLELGIDLFCNGDPYFHPNILRFLPLAYYLLKRNKFGEIVHAHLKNRKTGDDLADADL